jgi:hypothetical protein
MNMIVTPFEHMTAELYRLDLLLHREILRLRAAYQLSLDEFRGLYISDEQVDQLVQRSGAGGAAVPTAEVQQRSADEARDRAAAMLEGGLPWAQLAARFELDPFERDCLLIALAPEFDLKYETLYAYLNNDITRKWPTIDLAIRLTGRTPEDRLDASRRLQADGRLFRSGLLQPIAPFPERTAWLSTGFRPAPILAPFVRGETVLDPRLSAFCRFEACAESPDWDDLPVPAALCRELSHLGSLFKRSQTPMLVFLGGSGSGRHEAARAVCFGLGKPLLLVNLGSSAGRQDFGPLLGLHTRLLQAGVYLQEADSLFEREGTPTPESRSFLRTLAEGDAPVFLELSPGCDWRELLRGLPALPFVFNELEYGDRLKLWQRGLKRAGCSVPKTELASVADRFLLSPGQIEEAVRVAVTRQLLREESGRLTSAGLQEAAREASGQSLGRLAVKLETIHGWDDLVLPAATLRQTHEVTAAIRNYRMVYEEWGFAQRLSTGQGLKVLFSGASGTGKTMTAGVIGRDLGLDIYKIDLSSVVSKYIGETEKNLERIFRAAESSNAILFFDEADAIFGKRSEVKDAHDRYANVEVAYLLQRIEDHRGVVILASNLSQNIDEAFSRRMHYVIEFPLPDELHRQKLWTGMFPPAAPLGEDVDFKFLSSQFAITGGDIRNASLEAAFLAAQDGRVIRMQHLVRAMARQMLKQGKLPSPVDFKQHYVLIEQE